MTRPTPRKLTGKFIAALAAVSIAFAGMTAAPARAGSKDVARTVAALAAIFIIGSALNASNHRRAVTPPPPPPPSRPTLRRTRNVLPLQCVRWVDSDRGSYRILGKRCIQNRVGEVYLPRNCQRRFWDGRGRERVGYGRACLVNRGYRIRSVAR